MIRRFTLALLGLYRRWISPALHVLFPSTGCKFEPTCSEYALHAITLHGALRGSLLALHRLVRCHPFSKGGFDPVPMPENNNPRSGKTLHDPLP